MKHSLLAIPIFAIVAFGVMVTMKRKLCIVSLLCLVVLTMSSGESQGKRIETLTIQLNDKDQEVRRTAVVELRKLGKPSTVPTLIKALSDEDNYVRQRVANALGKIGKPEVMKAVNEDNI